MEFEEAREWTMEDSKFVDCVICGGALNDPYGHNPEPIVPFEEGRCCTDCNGSKVIPARIFIAKLFKP